MAILVMGIVTAASCGDPSPLNPGSGWQGPYYIGPGSSGATPIANPGSILDAYYGADQGSLSYNPSTSTMTYFWTSSTRDAENIYYGSFYLEQYNQSQGCWTIANVNGNGQPNTVNGGAYSDPTSAISSLAGSPGPSATLTWSMNSEAPSAQYRVIAYIYVRDTGTNPAWVDLFSYSGTASTPTPATTITTTVPPAQSVTIQEGPGAASSTWGACFAYTPPGGAQQPQLCAGNGQSSASELVPYGSVITYLCTSDWAGSSAYGYTSWSGAVSSSNPCISAGSSIVTVTGPLVMQGNYQLVPTTTINSPTTVTTVSTSTTTTTTPTTTITGSAPTTTSTSTSTSISTTTTTISGGGSPSSPLSVASITPLNPTILTGQSVTFSVAVSGGVPPYSYLWYTGISSTCSSDAQIGGATSATYATPSSAQGYYCVLVGDSIGDTVYSPTSYVTVNQPPGGPAPASPGGTVGAYFYPSTYKRTVPILTQTVSNQTCSYVVNATVSSFETLSFNGISYNLLTKYLTANTGTFILNGDTMILAPNSSQYLGAPGASPSFALFGIYSLMPYNYTAPVTVATVGICRNAIAPQIEARIQPPFVPVQFTLNIDNFSINATSSASNDTVNIYFNGVQMSSGIGSAAYNATWVPAGRYLVEGKDVDSGSFVNKTINKPYFTPQLSFTKSCKSSETNYTKCTTIAQVVSHNGTLLGSLFVNGKFIGSTNNTINYTPPHAGVYNITFKTAGNELYMPYTVSYQYVDDPFGAYAVPAIVVALSMCSLIMVTRKVKISKPA